jgi:hypothetical protein
MDYMKDKKVGDPLTFKVRRDGAVIELTGRALDTPAGPPVPITK